MPDIDWEKVSTNAGQRALWMRYWQLRTPESRDLLIMSYKGLVYSRSRKLSDVVRAVGLEEGDITGAAWAALVSAVDLYDPCRGKSSFATYACTRIDGTIKNYIRDHGTHGGSNYRRCQRGAVDPPELVSFDALQLDDKLSETFDVDACLDRVMVSDLIGKLPEDEAELIEQRYRRRMRFVDIGRMHNYTGAWAGRRHEQIIEKMARMAGCDESS